MEAAFVETTPKCLTHALPLVSTCRFAHLCRSRPRGSVRELEAQHEHGIADAEEEGARGLHSSKKLVELVMRTDPCPFNCVTGPFADSANVPAHSYRPVVRVAAQLFEFKRIVPGIFQK